VDRIRAAGLEAPDKLHQPNGYRNEQCERGQAELPVVTDAVSAGPMTIMLAGVATGVRRATAGGRGHCDGDHDERGRGVAGQQLACEPLDLLG
jgi:hypothetical protein